jgi:small redox-active disulfide protein 2
MTIIQVLGPGCVKCEKLYERTVQAAEELGIPYRIEKITDMRAIAGHGVLMTPALLVNGQIRVSGHVPTVEHIKEALA